MGEHILYAQENGFSPPVLSLGVLSGEGGFWSLLRISVIIHCDRSGFFPGSSLPGVLGTEN